MTSSNNVNPNALADLPRHLKKLLQTTDRGIERLYRTALSSTSKGNSSLMVAHTRTYSRHRPLPQNYLKFDGDQSGSALHAGYRTQRDVSEFLSAALERSSSQTPPELSFSEHDTRKVEHSVYSDKLNQPISEQVHQVSSSAVRFAKDRQYSTRNVQKKKTFQVIRRPTKHSLQTRSGVRSVANNSRQSELEEGSFEEEYQNHCDLFDTRNSLIRKRHNLTSVRGQHQNCLRDAMEGHSPPFMSPRLHNNPPKRQSYAESVHSSVDSRRGLASVQACHPPTDATAQTFITTTENSTRAFNSPGTASSIPIRTRGVKRSCSSWAMRPGFEESKNKDDDTGEKAIAMKSHFGKRWCEAFNTLFDAAEYSAGLIRAEKSTSDIVCEEEKKKTGKRKTESCISTTPAPEASTLKPDQTARASTRLGALPHFPELPSLQKEPDVTPTVTDLSGTVLRLEHQLRQAHQEREHLVLQLRLKHAEEMALVRQEVAKARADAVEEATEKIAASYAVKQGVLQSTLELEAQRLAETKEELCRTTAVLDQCRQRLSEQEAALKEGKKTDEHLKKLIHEQEELKKQFLAKDELCEQYKADLKTLRVKEQHWAQRDIAWERRLKVLEDRLQEQEEAARITLHQLEMEFAATTGSYQELLSEATERMAHLEKVHRKYKALKEAHTSLCTDKEKQVAESEKCMREWQSERGMLEEENKGLKQQLQSSEDALQQLSAAHKKSVDELKRQSDLQKTSTTDQTKFLQDQVDTAHHTIQLLRTQIENLQREIAEEQRHNQELVMRMAEKELKLHQEKQEQQRSALTFKANSEETIAALKRQLRGKDAQLLTLAAKQDEPLQSLRAQLEKERSRRAQLEAQFTQYKRKAKDAQEAALREIRKEKLRSSGITTSCGSFAPPAPVTATPPTFSVNETLNVQKRTRHITGAKTASSASTKTLAKYQYRTRSIGSSTPRSAPSSPKWTQETNSMNHNGRYRKNHRSTSFRGSVSPPQVQVTRIDSTLPGSAIADKEKGSKHTRQYDCRTSANQPHWLTDRARSIAPSQCHKGQAISSKTPTDETPRTMNSFPAQQFSHVTAALPGSSDRTPKPDSLMQPEASTRHKAMPPVSISNDLIIPQGMNPVGAGSLSTDSISCISNTSPCNSTSQLELPERPVFFEMLQVADSNTKRAPSSKDVEKPSSNAKHNQGQSKSLSRVMVSEAASAPHADSAPWYHFSQKRREEDGIVPHRINLELQQKNSIDLPHKSSNENSAFTQVLQVEQPNGHDNVPVEDHDRRMQEFQASAAEIFKKITSSREEFLAQCTSIVRQSATMCHGCSGAAND